jgi:hypothetical protein
MKKRLFIIPLLALLLLLVNCGKKQNPKDYKIDVSSFANQTVELGETYVAPTPKVYDKKGKELPNLVVEVKKVVDGDNNEINVTRGRFLPAKVGKYTITYGVKENELVPQVNLVITCVDTTPPTFRPYQIVETGFTNQEIQLPTFTVEDLSGVDTSKEEIIILNPNGEEVEVVDGMFIPLIGGNYTYKVTQYDKVGNSDTKEYTLFVENLTLVEDQIAYLDVTYGLNQAKSYYGFGNYTELSYQTEIKHGEESGALKLVKRGENFQSVGITVQSAIKDISGYDYIGFYFYNDNNIAARVYVSEVENEYGSAVVVPAHSWQFIAYDNRANFATESRQNQIKTNFKELVIFVQDIDQSAVRTGHQYYIGAIKGYKNDNLEGVYARFDQVCGTVHIGLSSSFAINQNYLYTTLVHKEEELGSYEYEIINEAGAEGFVRIYNLLDGYQAYSDYTIWIYNPNDFAIKVNSNQGDALAVIPATSSLDYTIKVDNSIGQTQLFVKLENGEKLPNGAKFNIGNLRGKTLIEVEIGTKMIADNITVREGIVGETFDIVLPKVIVDGIENKDLLPEVSITDPDGLVVTIEENKFTPTKEGAYQITYKLEGADDLVIDIVMVRNIVYTEGKNVLSHMGEVIVAGVYVPTTAEAIYQMTTVHEGDLGAAKLTILSSIQNSGIEVVPEKKDWSSYDYVGFWVYNGKAEIVEVFPFGNGDLQRTEAAVGKWTFIAWDLKAIEIRDGSSNEGVLQNLTNVNKVGIKIATRGGTGTHHKAGDYFLISPIRGYNFVNENIDGIIRFDEASGVGAVGLQSGGRIGFMTWEYDQTVKADGEAGSTKFTSTVNDKMQIRIQKLYFTHTNEIDTMTLKMWVNNPNTYNIKLFNQVIPANSSGYVEFPITDKSTAGHGYGPRLLIEITKEDGSGLEIDSAVYLGAIVRKKEVVLDDSNIIIRKGNINEVFDIVLPRVLVDGVENLELVPNFSVVNPNGLTVTTEENKFTPTKEGIYQITYTLAEAEDLIVNISVGIPYTEGENVISHMGEVVVASVYAPSTAEATYQTVEVYGEDVGAAKLTILSSMANNGIEVVPQKKDWSSYDYIGFWVYNGKAEIVEVFPFGNGDLQRTEAAVGKWTFIAWDLKAIEIRDGSSATGVLQDLTNVSKIGIKIATRGGGGSFHQPSDYFLISPIRGYNFVNENVDGVIRFDEASGVGAVGLQSGGRIGYFTWEYDETVKADGEAGSTKFTSTVNDKMQIRIQKMYFEDVDGIDTATLRMWVNNSNSYGIKVNGVVIAANSSGYAEFPISDKSTAGHGYGPRLLIEITKEDGTNLEVDTVVYLGAIVIKP